MARYALLLALLLAGCTASATRPPSLAPRAAEAIDPRLPVPQAAVSTAVEPGLAARLTTLVAQAEAGDGQFRAAAPAAERAAGVAGVRGSESWVAAQQAVSALVAARGPVTRALADIDSLTAERIKRVGGIGAGEMAAIEAAARQVAAIDRRQAALVDQLQARLG